MNPEQTTIQVPRIGSKDWPWEQLDVNTHVLRVDGMVYCVRVGTGMITVCEAPDWQDSDYHDDPEPLDIAEFEPSRFDLEIVKRFCELDARRKARVQLTQAQHKARNDT